MLLWIPELLFIRSVRTISGAWSRHAVGPDLLSVTGPSLCLDV